MKRTEEEGSQVEPSFFVDEWVEIWYNVPSSQGVRYMESTSMRDDSVSSDSDRVTIDWMRILRAAWWLLALGCCLYLIIIRLDSVSSDKPTSFDTGLLAIAAILILLPFISEISAFGFTVKKQIEEAKKELKGSDR
jgi:hypothetical protein